MKKYMAIIFLLAAGCASSLTEDIRSVSNRYETLIFDDGISSEEAMVIAQREMIKQNFVKLYDLASPSLVTDVSDLPNYEDYWFVSFEERKRANIPYIFMVIVNKHTGKIKFAEDLKEDKRWILEAALLRQ